MCRLARRSWALRLVAFSGGQYVNIPAYDVGKGPQCGKEGCRYKPQGTVFVPPNANAALQENGRVGQMQQDTGIWYSTNLSTTFVAGGVGSLDPTGAPPNGPIYNQWDYNQVKAFGIGSSLSDNDGKGNTPLITDTVNGVWFGTGSPVAGPNTYYTNDYNPSCQPSNTDVFADLKCNGPWQRIQYPNAKIAGSGPIQPGTVEEGNTDYLLHTNTSVVTTAGHVLCPVTLCLAPPMRYVSFSESASMATSNSHG